MLKLFWYFSILTGFSFDISTIACRVSAGNFNHTISSIYDIFANSIHYIDMQYIKIQIVSKIHVYSVKTVYLFFIGMLEMLYSPYYCKALLVCDRIIDFSFI